jgi:hypothetical protein
MTTVWSLSVLGSVCFMTVPQFSVETGSMCIPLENNNKKPVVQYPTGIGVGLYSLAIVLYGHMYVDVKKTTQKTVQLQRENRLARRMALIVFTNVFFFILPFGAVTIVVVLKNSISQANQYIFYKTFGITCLGINSCLNPILFSFRNEKFRNEVRRLGLLCKNSIASQP